MKIAAFEDNKGNSLPFNASGIVKVYEQNDNKWVCMKEIPFATDEKMNLSDIRMCIYTMSYQLGDCKNLISKRIMGIFNAIFEEELGIKIWTAPGSVSDSLDSIKNQIETIEAQIITETKPDTAIDITEPLPVGDKNRGLYVIDLVKVQEKHDSLNSKDILLPFFKETTFQELEIICLHMPKWFDKELKTLNLEVYTENRKNGLCHAFVSPAKK
ncbi:MAG: Fe-only nitrogenase accessory protein AnfO [Dysgonomonas sp.]